MIVKPNKPPLYSLWGASLIAIGNNLPSAASCSRLLQHFTGVELSVKPEHFYGNIPAGLDKLWAVWLADPSLNLTYRQAFDVMKAHGLKLDLNWDPHNDVPGMGPKGYHRPPANRRVHFPFRTSADRLGNIALLKQVIRAIEQSWPGLIGRVTLSNEPYYQPSWPEAHTPTQYGQWVLDAVAMLDGLHYTFEVVAVAGSNFHAHWAMHRATAKKVTWGVHTVFPNPGPGADKSPEAFWQAAVRDINAVIASRPDKTIDIHQDGITFSMDEWVPHGRHGSPASREVADIYEHCLRQANKHGVSANILGIGGVDPVCDQGWQICTGLVGQNGDMTLTAERIMQLYARRPGRGSGDGDSGNGGSGSQDTSTKALESRVDRLEVALSDILGDGEPGLVRAFSALSRENALAPVKRSIMADAKDTMISARKYLLGRDG